LEAANRSARNRIDLIRELTSQLNATLLCPQAHLIRVLTGRLEAAVQSTRTGSGTDGPVAISGTKNKRNRTDLIRKLEHLLMQAEMELEWESMPATLRRNDPSVTIFSDEKHDVTVANAQFHSLGSALHFNTTVTKLRLSVSFQVTGTTIRGDNWEPLLHYIETSVVLQIVSLDEISYDRSNRDPICVNFTEHLMRAVGRNANIHALKFGNFVRCRWLPS
jgi:hypothetical protein